MTTITAPAEPARPRALTAALARLRLNADVGWVGAIALAGLALRLVWALHAETIPLGGDPSWYFSVARNLTLGHGFVADHEVYSDHPIFRQPTAFWPPAYPFALAGIWKVTGISLTAAKLLNVLCAVATVPFVYALGARIFSRGAGILAAAIFALFPNAIVWMPLLFPEEMFTLVMMAALWTLVAFRPGRTRAWLYAALAVGALTGLAALSRGQGLVLPPVAIIFWLTRDGWRRALRQSVLMLAVAAALIAPWTVRNWVVLDSPVLISSNGGVSLRTGHAPDSTGTSKWTADEVEGIEAYQSPYMPEWEVRGYRVYTRRAIDYALTHPRREFHLTRYKIYHLYRSDSGVIPWLTTLGVTPIEPRWFADSLARILDVSYYAVLFAAIAAVPLWLRRSAERQLIVSLVLWWTLFHIVFNGEPRYHVPLFPVYALSAAAGIATLVRRVRHGDRSSAQDGAAEARSHSGPI